MGWCKVCEYIRVGQINEAEYYSRTVVKNKYRLYLTIILPFYIHFSSFKFVPNFPNWSGRLLQTLTVWRHSKLWSTVCWSQILAFLFVCLLVYKILPWKSINYCIHSWCTSLPGCRTNVVIPYSVCHKLLCSTLLQPAGGVIRHLPCSCHFL